MAAVTANDPMAALTRGIAELSVREKDALKEVESLYTGQCTEYTGVLAQKKKPDLKKYIDEVVRNIDDLHKCGLAIQQKLLDVYGNQEGNFSSSDTVTATANLYRFVAAAKIIRRDIKLLSLGYLKEALDLQDRLHRVINTVYSESYKASHEHLDSDSTLQVRDGAKVTNQFELEGHERSFKRKVEMTIETLEQLQELRSSLVSQPRLPKIKNAFEKADIEKRMEKLAESLGAISARVTSKDETLPGVDYVGEIIRVVRTTFHALRFHDFNDAFALRCRLKTILDAFSQKITSFAVEQITVRDCQVIELVNSTKQNATFISQSDVAAIQGTIVALSADTEKMLKAIKLIAL